MYNLGVAIFVREFPRFVSPCARLGNPNALKNETRVFSKRRLLRCHATKTIEATRTTQIVAWHPIIVPPSRFCDVTQRLTTTKTTWVVGWRSPIRLLRVVIGRGISLTRNEPDLISLCFSALFIGCQSDSGRTATCLTSLSHHLVR